ncbi:aspartate/glutamate racemase family protein [Litorimonas sp. WD9-15]|uniref:aspartate/glutamate racemase family protein n=1 Tax=Litorimonas sp. WD9-15 TaxID=3418716 RepID=UPI003D071086
MKTIGLIGGMSWESSAEYYRICNETVQSRLGGSHSAKIIMWSVDFAPIADLQHEGRWDELSAILSDAALSLEKAGADMIVICTNTMHCLADKIAETVSIPLIHIADAAAAAVKSDGLKAVGLLGTSFTMEQGFYRDRIEKNYDLDVIIPNAADRDSVHTIIYEELVRGIISETSRQTYQESVARLVARGAQGIILGCTEIGLLLRPEDCDVPLYDTAKIHALAAVEAALKT